MATAAAEAGKHVVVEKSPGLPPRSASAWSRSGGSAFLPVVVLGVENTALCVAVAASGRRLGT